MDFKVRSMTAADWDAVAKIYKQGIDSGLATFRSTVPDYDVWDADHLTPCRLVICDGDIVVGWAALSAVSNRCEFAGIAEISIYIHSAYQGKGVGVKLMDAAIDASEQAGVWSLYSAIMSNNIASIRLHEKCGFREIGYREKMGKDGYGVWRNVTMMERRSKLPQYN